MTNDRQPPDDTEAEKPVSSFIESYVQKCLEFLVGYAKTLAFFVLRPRRASHILILTTDSRLGFFPPLTFLCIGAFFFAILGEVLRKIQIGWSVRDLLRGGVWFHFHDLITVTKERFSADISIWSVLVSALPTVLLVALLSHTASWLITPAGPARKRTSQLLNYVLGTYTISVFLLNTLLGTIYFTTNFGFQAMRLYAKICFLCNLIICASALIISLRGAQLLTPKKPKAYRFLKVVGTVLATLLMILALWQFTSAMQYFANVISPQKPRLPFFYLVSNGSSDANVTFKEHQAKITIEVVVNNDTDETFVYLRDAFALLWSANEPKDERSIPMTAINWSDGEAAILSTKPGEKKWTRLTADVSCDTYETLRQIDQTDPNHYRLAMTYQRFPADISPKLGGGTRITLYSVRSFSLRFTEQSPNGCTKGAQ